MINNHQFQSSLDRFEKQRKSDVRTITMYNHAKKKEDPLNQTVTSDLPLSLNMSPIKPDHRLGGPLRFSPDKHQDTSSSLIQNQTLHSIVYPIMSPQNPLLPYQMGNPE